jgi:hypothetical protein
LVSDSTDQTVRLSAADTGDHVLTIPIAVQVYGARFSRDGTRLVVMPMDGTVDDESASESSSPQTNPPGSASFARSELLDQQILALSLQILHRTLL